jgi:RHS repeat-associated protein
MMMPGRSYAASVKYRYGFNGKENDNEVKVEGGQQDYGMRIYDTRLGKFLSVDPLTKSFPELTPYQFGSNSPIESIDLDGLEALSAIKSGLTRQFEAQVKLTLTPPKAREIEILVWNTYRNQAQIGRVSVVVGNINAARTNYYNAVGENIRGGFFGSAGYILKGEAGSFYGAALDGVAMSFVGLPAGRSSVLSKNKGISILSEGYKPPYTTSPIIEPKPAESVDYSKSYIPNFEMQFKGGNLYRTATLNETKFEFASGHSYDKPHLNKETGVITKFDPRIASMDAVEFSIMNNINFMKTNSNIIIPDISNSAGRVAPYQGSTNVNGLTIKYNAVQANGQIKISDYMIQ